MIFYKDEKSAEVCEIFSYFVRYLSEFFSSLKKKGNQYEAPLGVCDLRGAKLKWLEGDKTRRRRVFQVTNEFFKIYAPFFAMSTFLLRLI